MKSVSLDLENISVVDSAKSTAVKNRQERNTNVDNEDLADEKQKQQKGLTVEISDAAMEKYREALTAMENLKEAKKNENSGKDTWNELGKIMVIFRRISHGDYVPRRDEQKLMEYSGELYQIAKAAAAMANNKKPKQYKSVDEEDKQNEGLCVNEISSDDITDITDSEEIRFTQ